MTHPITRYALLLMIVGGVVLRIQNVGYPFNYGFDEHQYAGAAHQFLVGVTDSAECCHPPLSKLLIGIGMLVFGNTPLGWRFVPLCFGIQCIVLAYLITTSLFRNRTAGWLAAAFMAADGFYLAYSRASLPDIILACLVQWCMLAAITARGWLGVLVCALLVGVASSIKWVALLVGLPACFAILLLKRAPWYSLVSFAVVPVVHVAIWMVGLDLIGHPSDLNGVWQEIQARRNFHLGFPHGTNPLESAWYTWLVLYHPIVLKSAHVGESVRLASSVGNPLLWITADICLLGLAVSGIAVAASARFRARWKERFDPRFSKAVAILGVTWLSMMLLWMSGRIVTYWYHYLTPWGFAIMLVAGIAARLEREFSKEVRALVLVVLVVSVYFAPVWAELPISASAVKSRLFFPLWR
jgi:dolichyl-phosphate-mannose--protein O-mannosyl transferase